MIRRAAWRAVGLTELPAAQRKRSRLHGRAAPFRGRTAPEAEGVVTARGEPGAQVGGRSTRRGALAPGAGASERAAAAVAHVARAGQRPHPRTAPAGSGGRREIFPGGRRRRVRGAVGAHRGAPGGADRGARARGGAGTRYRAHRKNAIYPLSVLLGGWGMPRFPFTRGVINPNRGPGSVTRVITR